MSTDRVAFVVLHVDGDVARAMSSVVDGHEGIGIAQLRRPNLTNQPSTLATLVTGARNLRHGVFSRLVPVEGRTRGATEAMVEAGLGFRTSRDFGAPTIWNRLSSRGVSTAVVGWPYAEAKDDEKVHEVSMGTILNLARRNEIPVPDAILGAIRGAVEVQPETACICVHGWFRGQSSEQEGIEESAHDDSTDDPTDDPTDDSTDDGDATEGTETDDGQVDDAMTEKAERILRWLDAIGNASSAKHLVAVLVGPRIGRYLLFGPHGAGLDGQLLMPYGAVPTVLALLGQSPAGDLSGKPIVEIAADSEDPPVSGWSIEGGTLSPSDFGPAFQRVIAGEGGSLLLRTVVRNLNQQNWVGMLEGDPAFAVEAGRRLVQIDDSPRNRLRLVVALVASGEKVESIREIEQFGRDHPESRLADLVTVIPIMQRSDEEVAEVLDRVPFEELSDSYAHGIWARAAVRIGRDDEGMKALWRLIKGGYALNRDRILFAQLAVKRNQGDDVRRAALATRGMTGLSSNSEGRPRTGVAIIRAKVLDLAGHRPLAIRLLEQFVEHHPLEEEAVRLLALLREAANEDSGVG